jgi:RNA polymerase sigma-70 factor, ECF subfamily
MKACRKTRGVQPNVASDRNAHLERLENPVNEPSSRWAAEVANHRAFLYKYAVSRLWQRAAAEDVVQEAMLAALECEHAFKGDSALRTWLTGILKHKIADWHRREGRAGRGESSAGTDLESDFDESPDVLFEPDGRWIKPPSDWPDPQQCLENRKFWEVFESCLADLPKATGRAFLMREIEGMSTAEICDALGISESNCWVMLHRARLRLREQLERRWFGQSSGSAPKRATRRTETKRAADNAPTSAPRLAVA